MAVEIIMPKMGESITEGTIIEWKKNVGDKVKKDETILEISTDKVDTEVPSPSSGIIIEISAKPNDTVEVGAVIGIIGESVDDTSTVVSDDNIKIDQSASLKEESSDNEVKQVVSTTERSKRFYSPLVRSIAKKNNISLNELDSINGSGKGGRVNKSDIMEYIYSKDTPTSTINLPSLEDDIEQMDPVRQKIAEHMIQSQRTSAHVYSTIEIDMTNIILFKSNMSRLYNEKHSIKLTITSLILDCCIKALHQFPMLNSSIDGNNIIHHKNINMGVAVALEDDNLIVPVIKSSEELNLIGISRSISDLASRARDKKLNIDDVQGSTFTLTNPGVFGGLMGMPIINQPNVGILSIGKIQKKPIVKETEFGDSVFIRSMMYATLGYDHRLIDGAYGTKFLAYLSKIIEKYGDE